MRAFRGKPLGTAGDHCQRQVFETFGPSVQNIFVVFCVPQKTAERPKHSIEQRPALRSSEPSKAGRFAYFVMPQAFQERAPTGTSPERSWDFEARFEDSQNILKGYSTPLLSSHPVYPPECSLVRGKSDSRPLCPHANK
jgi:hypothetical protein